MLIDFHAHAFLDKLAANAVSSLAARAHFTPFCDGTVDGTARLMREQGVDRFAVLNIAVSPKTERHVNDFAISLLDRGDTVLPFGSVHPSSPDAFSELERLKNAGIRGIKFHNEYQNFFVDDEIAFPVYERCAELGFIMLFHGGADRGFSPPVKTAPRRMRRVALRFPQAKIIVAHLGGQDMQQEAIDELADTNVYIDTSFVSRSVEPSVAERSIRAFGFDRVIFGSDCPWDTPANTVAFLQAMDFSQEEYEKIYSKNALKILGE
ncbi:MAG TPA: amidohydrolase [Candidatus Borkfalkia excrementigallinarum]|uniref:Amidohydrolase n=1 Tax=Candidatus Borkfalkia excrementigallinarum TaxID=2838506 RepID=A0A9D2CT60_9FIRM|nr:amidohydrolase [Candidatus Borkfalkia excrementigallinarum]